jgi:hypothetical protein
VLLDLREGGAPLETRGLRVPALTPKEKHTFESKAEVMLGFKR